MNLILKTKYTLSTEFVLAQVRGNNHWRTSQVRLEILNDRTLHSSVVMYLFLHVLYSVKACKISITLSSLQYGILVLLSNPSIIAVCMCIFLYNMIVKLIKKNQTYLYHH